ncbi:MAG: hypothetical protein COS82_06860 [Zetaproteobacteria bacterium CG06_land_8_20_14_3_00_59_53]|nr:MAG: hypothetical protein AUK36_03785 [Zetaproteobacteria bacterium CG2_30_59_37]PIO89890.1 MAG: hypothetical protein COX56_05805 [Zetaproteobacteria bacterium CG23_combo_of_CG06-09_8_20_14_all_59_86]PIQ64255.1 MAG: hypothetical protein COV97_10060 [Zetaproteobacteria bacterium CG11_big_fil_rev_8_21_14_0_20_59_439]PIU70399.1 MAG: hypothetical protein COS82_06860 [Zetaproteobacteria bacterium CG06_land_8_20_14_3_00_59_53]PIU97477.1 MAG: hypothetical protein COS62_03685 [Zetaproteobacteria bac
MLEISAEAKQFCSNAIFITGPARSGTSIVGKIIHSLNLVEYAYEPPMMVTLMSLIDRLDAADWKLLCDTYIYEEFFLNAIAGRAINCNSADFSSIYGTKTVEDVERRLSTHFTKKMCQESGANSVVAIKIPDVVHSIPKLKTYYPTMRVVVVLRDAVDTINSLLQKEWFSPKDPNSDLVWPFRRHKGVNVPFWVRPGDDELWLNISEVDRAAYYYIRVNEDVERIDGRIELRYGHLLENPHKATKALARSLGLDFGAKTEEVINNIRPTNPVRDKQLIASISSEFRDKVEHYSQGV